MVRKETVLVAFMACLLLVASFTVCAHATEGRRMLASEKVYYPQAILIISYDHVIPYVDTPRKNGVPSRTPIMEPKIWNLERDNDWVEIN
uniref:Uncharacterized protein n=1 Tax=Salix viminalis TaxID=40686 RepID=A0A6N2K1E0_SALVM